MDTTNIQLVDKTAPAERATDDLAGGFSRTSTSTSTGSRLWNRPSIRAGRARRKYAKWQPDRLGVAPSNEGEADQPSSDEGGLLRAGTMTNTLTNTSTIQEGVSSDHTNGYQSDSQGLFEQNNTAEQIQQQDFGAGAGNTSGSESGNGTTHQSKNHPTICGLKPGSELDILSENQRGWFFFGIPLYSSQSLLNMDPPSWVNASGKRSFVNITNAQLPDPSWEWAWKTWYVDMSGDVDEQGWQYAFSFSLSSSWHGTHPFWHSFVRRRRWVRLRVKKVSPAERQRRSRTGLEMGHTLNEDYFTIHTEVRRKRASSSERASRTTSVNLESSAANKEGDEGVDEIRNIPSLMYAIKVAIVDREKFDAVRNFVDEGGEEIYYLDGKIPEIMNRLVYQTSRWQLLAYLNNTIQNISQQQQSQEHNEQTMMEVESLRRKHEYLSCAADTAERHLVGPEVFHEPNADEDTQRASETTKMLDLSPGNRKDSLLSRVSGKYSFQPMDNGGEIRGIPAEAEIGHDFHIY